MAHTPLPEILSSTVSCILYSHDVPQATNHQHPLSKLPLNPPSLSSPTFPSWSTDLSSPLPLPTSSFQSELSEVTFIPSSSIFHHNEDPGGLFNEATCLMPPPSPIGIATFTETPEPILLPHKRDRTNSPKSLYPPPKKTHLLSKEDKEIFKERGFVIDTGEETLEGDENLNISTDSPELEVFEGIGGGSIFQLAPSAVAAAQISYEGRQNFNCWRPAISSQSPRRRELGALSMEDQANFMQLNTFTSPYMIQHMADMYGQSESHAKSNMSSSIEEGDNSGIYESAVSSTGSGATASLMRAPRSLSTEDEAKFVQLNTFASPYMRQHMTNMYGQPEPNAGPDMGSNGEEDGIQESAVSSTGSGVTASDTAIT